MSSENIQNSAPEMSVAGRNLKEENEVSTMTTDTVNVTDSITDAGRQVSTSEAASEARTIRSSAEYNASERFVAHVGLALLRWSNRRWDRAQPTHERMALMLENERVRARHDGCRRSH